MQSLPTPGLSVQNLPDIPHMPTAPLRGLERLIVPLMDAANTTPWLKAGLQRFLRLTSGNWMRLCSQNLWEMHGLAPVAALQPPRGVILVANHRSFFDMYVTSAMLYRHARFMERMYFPVRSNFFYTNPLGPLINLTMAAGAMWPPVFRDDRRDQLNPVGVQQMQAVLARKGSVIGIHPEGTRSKDPDPWHMLPFRPGVGHLVQTAHPETVIVPFYINGMSNRAWREVLRNFLPAGRRGLPIRMRFAAPLTAQDLQQHHGDAAAITRALEATIRALAEEDRAQYDHP